MLGQNSSALQLRLLYLLVSSMIGTVSLLLKVLAGGAFTAFGAATTHVPVQLLGHMCLVSDNTRMSCRHQVHLYQGDQESNALSR